MMTTILVILLLISIGLLWWLVNDIDRDPDLERVLIALEEKRQEKKHGK